MLNEPEPHVIHTTAFERLFIDVGGLVAFPRGETKDIFGNTHFGYSFHFGLGMAKIPLAFGIGFHESSLSEETYVRPGSSFYVINGVIGSGDLHESVTATVRHVDAFVRLEPPWRRFRPYLELRGGTAQVFIQDKLSTRQILSTMQQTVAEEEVDGDGTWSWGYGVGVHVEPWAPAVGPLGSVGLVITAGVMWMSAGGMKYLQTREGTANGQPATVVDVAAATLRTTEPFLAIGLVSRNP
jgi:hypothetical protein